MDVVVEVKWKGCQAADGTDAFINITFTVGELVEESRFERLPKKSESIIWGRTLCGFCACRCGGANP